MKVAIVGTGITGLTAGLKLSQKGHEVVLFEKEEYAGGLSAGFRKKGWDWHLEFFFHHFFATDKEAKKLIRELGLEDKLFYLRPKTSVFKQGKIYQFDSPLSVLKFPLLSFPERLRTGLVTLFLKSYPRWQSLEKTKASGWLKKYYGQKTYEVLWQPLLGSKFGKQAGKISMAWFWARIKKRSARLGYLEGGFQPLIDELVKKIKQRGGKILLNHEVKNLDELENFDRIIITTPAEIFLKIAPQLPKEYQARLEKFKMLGAVNLILELKEQFLKDKTYWLNISEESFPFVAVVEHTNFVNPKYYNGNHLVYVGGYYPQNHRYFRMSKDRILKEFLPYLKKISPRFNQSSLPAGRHGIINHQSSISKFAQHIVPPHYSQIIPNYQTPLKNIFLANMQQVYPWDRGVNYAIELGEKVVDLVHSA
jgi:protoporphyrinogen oxidase